MTKKQALTKAFRGWPWVAFLLAVVPSLAGCRQQLMPTPNLYTTGQRNPFTTVPPALQNNQVEIIYVTDRAPLPPKNGKTEYGYGRSRSLAFGTCTVSIGDGLAWEELVQLSRTRQRAKQPALSLVEIKEVVRFPEGPRRRTLVDEEMPEQAALRQAQFQTGVEQFHHLLAERLALTPRKEAYVFIHGFNNTFEDAAFVIAQLWHFMDRQGVPMIYTWPAGSGASVLGYNYDRESSEFTVFHLKQFIRALAACPELEKINIIAHSRGTDVTLAALRELHIENRAAGLETRKALKLGNVVLAAPDLDIEVVSQRVGAEQVYLAPERITIYLSQNDRALGFADWLFSGIRRLGQARSLDLPPDARQALGFIPVNFIDATMVTTDWVGHSYFYGNPAVSSDLVLLLENRPPGAENGRPLKQREDNFWEIRDDYLLKSDPAK